MVPRIGKAVPLPHTMQLPIMLSEMVSYSSIDALLGGVDIKVFLLFIIMLTCTRQMTRSMMSMHESHGHIQNIMTMRSLPLDLIPRVTKS